MLLEFMELTWSSSATKILELLPGAVRYSCYRKNCNPYKVIREKILFKILADPKGNVTCVHQLKDLQNLRSIMHANS